MRIWELFSLQYVLATIDKYLCPRKDLNFDNGSIYYKRFEKIFQCNL